MVTRGVWNWLTIDEPYDFYKNSIDFSTDAVYPSQCRLDVFDDSTFWRYPCQFPINQSHINVNIKLNVVGTVLLEVSPQFCCTRFAVHLNGYSMLKTHWIMHCILKSKDIYVRKCQKPFFPKKRKKLRAKVEHFIWREYPNFHFGVAKKGSGFGRINFHYFWQICASKSPISIRYH